MAIKGVHKLAASQGHQFILNNPESWIICDPLSPALSIPILTPYRTGLANYALGFSFDP